MLPATRGRHEPDRYGGLRVGETLALTTDRMVRDGTEGCYRPHVVLRAQVEGEAPKHGRERHAWLPPDVDRVVAGTAAGALLYPAPRGGVWPVDRFRARRLERWLQTTSRLSSGTATATRSGLGALQPLPGIARRAAAGARAVGDPRTVADAPPRPD